jgi:hypothetical protein
MAREPKSAYTPKQVADYLKGQITTRGEGGLKSAFTNQFYNHFSSEELGAMGGSFQEEINMRAEQEIADLKRILEEKSGKSVELK